MASPFPPLLLLLRHSYILLSFFLLRYVLLREVVVAQKQRRHRGARKFALCTSYPRFVGMPRYKYRPSVSMSFIVVSEWGQHIGNGSLFSGMQTLKSMRNMHISQTQHSVFRRRCLRSPHMLKIVTCTVQIAELPGAAGCYDCCGVPWPTTAVGSHDQLTARVLSLSTRACCGCP